MKMNQLLGRVFKITSLVILAVMLVLCAVFQWDGERTVWVTGISLAISAAAVLSLHVAFWVIRRIGLSVVFAWMITMASMPLMVFVPASCFSYVLPGDTGFLTVLGMTGGYAGILYNGVAIAQLFKSST